MNSRYPKIEVSFGRAFICRSSFRNVLIRNTFQTCSGCIFTKFTQNCIIINFLINIFFVNIGKIFTWDFDKFKRLSPTLKNDTLGSDFHLYSTAETHMLSKYPKNSLYSSSKDGLKLMRHQKNSKSISFAANTK